MEKKAELGTKRICPSCAARFYDLTKRPIICPKCQTSFDPEVLLKPRRQRPEAREASPAKVVREVEIPPEEEDEESEDDDVSLEALEEEEEAGNDDEADADEPKPATPRRRKRAKTEEEDDLPLPEDEEDIDVGDDEEDILVEDDVDLDDDPLSVIDPDVEVDGKEDV